MGCTHGLNGRGMVNKESCYAQSQSEGQKEKR